MLNQNIDSAVPAISTSSNELQEALCYVEAQLEWLIGKIDPVLAPEPTTKAESPQSQITPVCSKIQETFKHFSSRANNVGDRINSLRYRIEL